MKTEIKKNDLIKIKKDFLNCKEEENLIYIVLSNPNSNNRVDIGLVKTTLFIPPIESVKIEHIEKIN